MATYHLEKDVSNQYYWILKSDKNGKTICMSSEAYASKQNAKDSIVWTKANAEKAKFIDLA